ncbi:hypothetical protein RMATCC62417_18011 [Rhizopus microsporus]|nr:hypothetical protein RMATCC62417_18011 [Rhizopus microsporus]
MCLVRFPMYKEITPHRKSTLYFIQTIPDDPTRKLRGYANVRTLFYQLNQPFFNCIGHTQQSKLPLPRFYISKNRALLAQGIKDPNASIAVLYNVRIEPIPDSPANLLRFIATVIIVEPIGEIHAFHQASIPDGDKRENGPSAWMKMQIVKVVENVQTVINSEIDKMFLRGVYRTFRLTTAEDDARKTSNPGIYGLFVRSILEPVSATKPNGSSTPTQEADSFWSDLLHEQRPSDSASQNTARAGNSQNSPQATIIRPMESSSKEDTQINRNSPPVSSHLAVQPNTSIHVPNQTNTQPQRLKTNAENGLPSLAIRLPLKRKPITSDTREDPTRQPRAPINNNTNQGLPLNGLQPQPPLAETHRPVREEQPQTPLVETHPPAREEQPQTPLVETHRPVQEEQPQSPLVEMYHPVRGEQQKKYVWPPVTQPEPNGSRSPQPSSSYIPTQPTAQWSLPRPNVRPVWIQPWQVNPDIRHSTTMHSRQAQYTAPVHYYTPPHPPSQAPNRPGPDPNRRLPPPVNEATKAVAQQAAAAAVAATTAAQKKQQEATVYDKLMAAATKHLQKDTAVQQKPNEVVRIEPDREPFEMSFARNLTWHLASLNAFPGRTAINPQDNAGIRAAESSLSHSVEAVAEPIIKQALSTTETAVVPATAMTRVTSATTEAVSTTTVPSVPPVLPNTAITTAAPATETPITSATSTKVTTQVIPAAAPAIETKATTEVIPAAAPTTETEVTSAMSATPETFATSSTTAMSTTSAISVTAIETRNKESIIETVRLEQKEETVNSVAIVPMEISSEDLAKRTQLYEFRSRQLFCKLIDLSRELSVPVENINSYRFDIKASPNAEGYFKQVYFLRDDKRKVVQTFRRMTTAQRVTEIASLLKLKDKPHIGQITEVIEENGEIIGLSMERYQKTLKQYTHAHSHHRLTAHQKMDLVIQLLECMKTIHDHGLAHRDLSEVNFMVNETEERLPDGSTKAEVYLIDFGKSTFVFPADVRQWWIQLPPGETESSEIVPTTEEELKEWCDQLPWMRAKPDHGYRLYRSIQTMPKSRVDTQELPWLINPLAEDMYSIGTIIWKMFAETEPWYGILETDIKSLRDIVSDDYNIEKALEREVPGKLSKELLLHTLKVTPQERKTADEMLAWIKNPQIKEELINEWQVYAPVDRQKRHAKKFDDESVDLPVKRQKPGRLGRPKIYPISPS